MNRPSFEVADIIRATAESFIDQHCSWLNGLHRNVLLTPWTGRPVLFETVSLEL